MRRSVVACRVRCCEAPQLQCCLVPVHRSRGRQSAASDDSCSAVWCLQHASAQKCSLHGPVLWLTSLVTPGWPVCCPVFNQNDIQYNKRCVLAAGLKSYAHSIPPLHTPSILSGGESRPATPPPGFLGPHFIADAAAKAAPAVVNITVSQGRL